MLAAELAAPEAQSHERALRESFGGFGRDQALAAADPLLETYRALALAIARRHGLAEPARLAQLAAKLNAVRG